MAVGRTRIDAQALAALTGPARARRKFLRTFPGGFSDETYLDWERDYKVEVHRRWKQVLGKDAFKALLDEGDYADIATEALRIEQRSRHPMLFSFEKMALRDAVRSPSGARAFAEGLYRFLHGPGSEEARFKTWRDTIETLPRRQTRVLTWPVMTVFGFIAQPRKHIFLKPRTVRAAAATYGYDLRYYPHPNWETYASYLGLARAVKRDMADLRPRDMIDAQSFLWVLGSDEYA